MNTHLVSSLDIIRAVKPHPFLYDRHIKSSIREKADKWAELGEQLGISGHQMQTRWKSIKDKYTLLKRRAEAYPGTNLGRQIEFYKYADDLTFLDETIPPYTGLPPKNRCYKYVGMNKSWEKAHTLLVIKQLSNFPLLYDKSHPHYNHCLQRMAAYRKITEVVKRYNPGVTPEMISKKIRTIRTQFAKEKRDQRKSKVKPGTSYIPKLWFYNRLKFLDETQAYDPANVSGNDAADTFDEFDGRFSGGGESGRGVESVDDEDDDGGDKDPEEVDDEDDEEYNDAEEWISSKESTRPFEQVELLYADEENIEAEGFEGEIEEVFDTKHTIKRIEPCEDNRNQTREDLYVKCTSLLESLSNQIKPYERGETNRMNCKNCPPSSMLGKMIESELAKVSEHIYVDAKWKIIRILEEAQKKSLREKQDQLM